MKDPAAYGFTPKAIETWDDFLTQFRRTVYPLFERHGVSFEAGLLLWQANLLKNTLDDDDGEESEPWRG